MNIPKKNRSFEIHTSTAYIFEENTCSSQSGDWDYSSLADLEQQCSDSSNIDDRASTCCSDGLSVCNQFVSQLCATDANYMPDAPA